MLSPGDIVPNVTLNSVGVVDMNATDLNITRGDVWDRLTSGREITRYGVKTGDYLNQWDFSTLLRTHPTCYPYGVGSPSNINLKRYFSWAMRYSDGRFSHNKFFYFDMFGIQQKREIWSQSRVTFLRKDWTHLCESMQSVTKHDIERAVDEEKKGQRISNPVIEQFIRTAIMTRSKIVGSNTSRARFRSDIWGTCVKYGNPSLFLTINPADHNDPIAHYLAGGDIDLDNVIPLLGMFSINCRHYALHID